MNNIFSQPSMVWLAPWCFVVKEHGLIFPDRYNIDYGTFRKNYMNVRQIRVFLIERPTTSDIVSFFVLLNGQASVPEVLALQEEASPLLDVEYKPGNKILREQLLPLLEPGRYVGPHCFKQKGEEPIHTFDPNQRKKPHRKKQSNPYTAKPLQKRRTAQPAPATSSSPCSVSHIIQIGEMARAVQDLPSNNKSVSSLAQSSNVTAPVSPAPDPPSLLESPMLSDHEVQNTSSGSIEPLFSDRWEYNSHSDESDDIRSYFNI